MTTQRILRRTTTGAPATLVFGQWAFADNSNGRPKEFFMGQNDDTPHRLAFDDFGPAVASTTINLGTNIQLSSLATPTVAGQAAEFQWVLDQIQAGIDGRTWKQPVEAAELVSNINLASPGATIDGVTLSPGDRFIAGNQSSAIDNGIYVFNGAVTPATRAADHNTGVLVDNSATVVDKGTNANRQIVFNIDGTETVGVDDIDVVPIGMTSTFTAGDGIDITGNVITVDATGRLGFDGGVSPNQQLILLSSGTANQILLSSGTVTTSPTYGALPLGDSNAVTGTLAILNGGTGATTAQGARNNLGVGVAGIVGDNLNVMQYSANFDSLKDAADGTNLCVGNTTLDAGDVIVYSGSAWEACHQIDDGTY